MLEDNALTGFKEKLDAEHQWPCTFMFKFIVPQAQASRLLAILEPPQHSARDSRSGKYVSLTIEQEVTCSEEVCMIYQKASLVPGVIAL